jgi:hypothetical protein
MLMDFEQEVVDISKLKTFSSGVTHRTKYSLIV